MFAFVVAAFSFGSGFGKKRSPGDSASARTVGAENAFRLFFASSALKAGKSLAHIVRHLSFTALSFDQATPYAITSGSVAGKSPVSRALRFTRRFSLRPT